MLVHMLIQHMRGKEGVKAEKEEEEAEERVVSRKSSTSIIAL